MNFTTVDSHVIEMSDIQRTTDLKAHPDTLGLRWTLIQLACMYVSVLCHMTGASDSCTRESGTDVSFPTDLPASCETVVISPHSLTTLTANDNAHIPRDVITFAIEDGTLSSIDSAVFNGLFIEEVRFGQNEFTTPPNLQVRHSYESFRDSRLQVSALHSTALHSLVVCGCEHVDYVG